MCCLCCRRTWAWLLPVIGHTNALEHVHFQRLAECKVLAVVVNKSGMVRDRLMRVGVDIPQLELDRGGTVHQ